MTDQRAATLLQLADRLARVLGEDFTGRVTINVKDGRVRDLEIGERFR